MRPTTLVERGVGSPSVSLAVLLHGGRLAIDGDTDVDLERYVNEIVRSDFPDLRHLDARVRRSQLHGYVERIIDRDIADLTGRTVRNPAALRRWLRSYAAATATSASYEKIRDAATSGDGDKPARSTTQPYRDALEALYLLDPVPAWSPSRSHIAELGEAPEHHLIDPALAASLLGVGAGALLDGEAGDVRHPTSARRHIPRGAVRIARDTSGASLRAVRRDQSRTPAHASRPTRSRSHHRAR
jgi:hypothetical protein